MAMIQAIVNGRPGSGKTSLCQVAQDKLGAVHIAVGDLLRSNIKQRTELGRIAKKAIQQKSLVPDDIVIQMVSERIGENDCLEKGWIIDGFPRTVNQALALQRFKIQPYHYIVLDIPEKEVGHRILGRRIDPETKKIYHSPNSMPVNPEVRDRIKKRSDDNDALVASRLEAYNTYASSTDAIYASTTHKIDGTRRLSEVYHTFASIVQENSNNSNDTQYDEENISDVPPTEETMNQQMQEMAEDINSVSDEDVVEFDNNTVLKTPFQERLKKGINVLKHGRRGSPHTRTVFCDSQCTRIFWQKIADELKPKPEQSIAVSTITHVVGGQHTDVMKRSGDKKNVERYVSLIAGDRTLDLEAPTAEDAQDLIMGFEALIIN